MILSNTFTVKAEVEDVWRHLLDLEGVAGCLPGATIGARDEDGVYDGSMRVRIGPMTVDYGGKAKLTEVDEESHTATMSLSAKAKKGQGTAMATVTNRLEPTEGGTRVVAETDLQVTGPQAQFGKGVMEDVGSRVLAEFASRLEQQIAGTPTSGPAGAEDGGGPAATSPGGQGAEEADDVLDLGSLVSSSMAGRYAVPAGIGLAIVLILILIVALRR